MSSTVATVFVLSGCSGAAVTLEEPENLLDRVRGAGDNIEPDGLVVPDALVVEVNSPSITAYADPNLTADVVKDFEVDPTYPLYFLALSTFTEYEAQDNDGWLEVLLPTRPNGSTGWIQIDGVTLYQNRFRIEIDVSDYTLTLYERAEILFTTDVAIGTGATPTPLGSFFTTVLYDVPNPDGDYGPYAFALSGFSDVLMSFNGGDGLIGIHGTNDPASIGTDVSRGCIRVTNDRITEMAERLPLGTPVTIIP